jgi:hypothetical protein
MGHEMIERPLDPQANDWDWRKGEPPEKRSYRIVQSAVDRHYPWLVTSAFRTWAARFGGLLMQQENVQHLQRLSRRSVLRSANDKSRALGSCPSHHDRRVLADVRIRRRAA